MTVLVVSIEHKGGVSFSVKSDNLRREDATDPEIAMANLVEGALNEGIKAMAAKIISESLNQSGPGARDGN